MNKKNKKIYKRLPAFKNPDFIIFYGERIISYLFAPPPCYPQSKRDSGVVFYLTSVTISVYPPSPHTNSFPVVFYLDHTGFT